ncbi:hypothetical protein [Streptomyces sp. NPDC058751]|uniref:hypothetical protein n=1 Tax=Streptomyces sp. NPDC058751 TaxID=3346623 RepID=UPI00368C68B4
MSETFVDLGVVTAPSGVLVLGMAGWIDHWSKTGDPLSVRALAAAEHGGGHLHEPADGPSGGWSLRCTATPVTRPGICCPTAADPDSGKSDDQVT